MLNIKPNDMILLTCQVDNQIGISQGFVKFISANGSRFSLLLDKNLIEWSGGQSNLANYLFRIDKINFRSAITLNYTNLGRLMSAEDRCAKLRELIVDKRTPTFQAALPKQYVLRNKSILKKLNASQQAAVIRVNHRLTLPLCHTIKDKNDNVSPFYTFIDHDGQRLSADQRLSRHRQDNHDCFDHFRSNQSWSKDTFHEFHQLGR